MDKLTERVRKTIKEHHMVKPGDRVMAALSGGADSVCLLRILVQLRDILGIRLRAVHVHHGLRGEEADRDSRFAEELCRELSVPFSLIYADVRGLADREGISEEEAGRILRYESFESEGKKWESEEPGAGTSSVKIAVAHHSGDQAETILHNLFRGSGLGGLKGMPYVRGNVIRPLLDVSGEEIREYLRERGFSWKEDSTNHTDHYTRNRIRREILPAVEKRINPGAGANILRMGKLAAMADSYLRQQAGRWLEIWALDENNGTRSIFLPEKPFKEADAILQLYAVMEVLKELAGSSKDLGLVHGQATAELFDRQPGRRIDLPYGLEARREYGGIRIGGIKAFSGKNREKEGASEGLDFLPKPVFTVFSYKKGLSIPKNMYTKWFDCDKIKGTPVIRTRQPGDELALSPGVHKPLRRYMIDEKIPSELRDRIPVLADGNRVMWVIGYRISSDYKIDEATKRVFQAELPDSEERKLPAKRKD